MCMLLLRVLVSPLRFEGSAMGSGSRLNLAFRSALDRLLPPDEAYQWSLDFGTLAAQYVSSPFPSHSPPY
jgi:hypothetical protein